MGLGQVCPVLPSFITNDSDCWATESVGEQSRLVGNVCSERMRPDAADESRNIIDGAILQPLTRSGIYDFVLQPILEQAEHSTYGQGTYPDT